MKSRPASRLYAYAVWWNANLRKKDAELCAASERNGRSPAEHRTHIEVKLTGGFATLCPVWGSNKCALNLRLDCKGATLCSESAPLAESQTGAGRGNLNFHVKTRGDETHLRAATPTDRARDRG